MSNTNSYSEVLDRWTHAEGKEGRAKVVEEWKAEQEKGIARVVAATSQGWKDEALRAGRQAAKENEFMTSQTILELMNPDIRDNANKKAMAGVLRTLSDLRLIKITDRVRNEKKKVNHGRPQRIWESLIFIRKEY